jgi:hypothetical protein
MKEMAHLEKIRLKGILLIDINLVTPIITAEGDDKFGRQISFSERGWQVKKKYLKKKNLLSRGMQMEEQLFDLNSTDN